VSNRRLEARQAAGRAGGRAAAMAFSPFLQQGGRESQSVSQQPVSQLIVLFLLISLRHHRHHDTAFWSSFYFICSPLLPFFLPTKLSHQIYSLNLTSPQNGRTMDTIDGFFLTVCRAGQISWVALAQQYKKRFDQSNLACLYWVMSQKPVFETLPWSWAKLAYIMKEHGLTFGLKRSNTYI
jgi:hypothetical protein